LNHEARKEGIAIAKQRNTFAKRFREVEKKRRAEDKIAKRRRKKGSAPESSESLERGKG
jgi:hypothetical protein